MITSLAILSLFCAVVCHYLARKRGANAVFWGVIGGLFGPFAIPFVLIAKPSAPKES